MSVTDAPVAPTTNWLATALLTNSEFVVTLDVNVFDPVNVFVDPKYATVSDAPGSLKLSLFSGEVVRSKFRIMAALAGPICIWLPTALLIKAEFVMTLASNVFNAVNVFVDAKYGTVSPEPPGAGKLTVPGEAPFATLNVVATDADPNTNGLFDSMVTCSLNVHAPKTV